MAEVEHDLGNDVRAMVIPSTNGAYALKVLDLDEYQPQPRRFRQASHVSDIASFIEYVKRYETDATVIFADGEDRSLTATLDFASQDAQSGWGDHSVSLRRKETRSFLAWQGRNGKRMSQYELATFLQDRLADITEPDGADLLELAQTFSATKAIAFRSQKRLDNGQVQVGYVEELDAGGVSGEKKIEVPRLITISVKPYRDADDQTYDVRLSWTMQGQAATFAIELPDALFDDLDETFTNAIAEVEAAVVAPVFRSN